MENKHCPNCGKALTDSALQGLCPECLMKAGWPTAPSTEDPTNDFTPPELDELAALFPQLEILEQIGKGGMGAVYKARQPELDRLVALKILIPKDPNDPGFAERFTREARALARLSHPNIVAVYDFGHIEELHYFVMEYVDGPNLRDIEKAGEMSPREALQVIPQICEALQFAHDEGIVHRDIKPENILLDRKGRVKIADFGLAKILGHEPQDLHLTLPGHVMGTPHYMAPEQVEHPQDVDHRADIYSLGVVFYEMLTGELPMGKFKPPSQKVQLDVRLDEIVLRTLAKEPELRYQQVSQVQTEVRTIASTPSTPPTNKQEHLNNQEPLMILDDFRSVQKRLWWPSVGLFLSGLIFFIYYISKLIDVISQSHATPPYEQWTFYKNLITSAYSIGIAIGAIYMHQLCHYGSTLLIAIFSGNLFGIWALVILCQKETRKAFQQNKTRKIIPRPSVRTIARSIGNCIGQMLSWARKHSILLAASLGVLCFVGILALVLQSGSKHHQQRKEQQQNAIKHVFAEAVYHHLHPYQYYAAGNEITLSPDLQTIEMDLNHIRLIYPRNEATFRDHTPISNYIGKGKWRIHFYDDIIVPDLIVDTSKQMKQGPVGIPPAPLPSPFDEIGLPYPQFKVIRAWDGVECLFPDPLAALQAWRQTEECQAWRKVKNITRFTYKNGMGYQFTIFAQAWQAGGPELLGGIELQRPDGTLLAKAVTFTDAESDYEILIYNESGDQAIAKVKVSQTHESDELIKHISEIQWGARGGLVEKTRVNPQVGTTHISRTWQWDRNGRYWLVNNYGVAYQEAFRTDDRHEEKTHLLPQFEDSPYTEAVTGKRAINGKPYWGPTHELTLKCNPDLSHCYADLTTGEVLSATPEALQRLEAEGRRNKPSLRDVVDACPSDSVDLLIWDDEFYILNPCIQRMAFEFSFADCSAPYLKLVQEKTLNTNQAREENELPLSSEPMCLMIITRQGRLGLLELQEYNEQRGERKLRCKLMESDDPDFHSASVHENDDDINVENDGIHPSQTTFGPEHEVTLKIELDDTVGSSHPVFLDLDSGRTLPLDGEAVSLPREEAMEWIAQQGMDLFIHEGIGWHGLESEPNNQIRYLRITTPSDNELKLTILPKGQQSDITPEKLQLLVGEWGKYRDHAHEYFLDELHLSDKEIAFCTADGTMGILNFDGFTDNPRCLKIRYKLAHTPDDPFVKAEQEAIPYSQTEYIVSAEPAPDQIGDQETLKVFNLDSSHQSGHHVRGNKFKDLLRTALMYGGDIYYYFDEQKNCGKVIFLRQEPWDREVEQSNAAIPTIALKDLPLEISISTIDGHEYKVRFSDPKAPRTGTMVGPLQGNPADLRKQCLVRTFCSNDGSFSLEPFEGDEFDAVADQILSNSQYRVFDSIFCAAYNGANEITAYCRYHDPVALDAFENRDQLTKCLTLKRTGDQQWQIVKGHIDYTNVVRPLSKEQLEKENPASSIKQFSPSRSTNRTPLSSQQHDFNDPNFWQAQISKHLEGVRTLDCDLIMERQRFGEDQNTPESRSRTRFNLKWDRDHQWIDCTAEPIDRKGLTERIICGSEVGWVYHGTDNWTKVKAGQGGVPMQIAGFGEMRSHPYEHAFGMAQGIICSDMIKRTHDQGVIDWQGMNPIHSTDDQGRHELSYTLPMPLDKDKVVNAELVLVGTWEQEAFKLLELRGRIPELGIDQLEEQFEDHLYANGVWIPQQVTIWGWDRPAPDSQGGIKPIKLYDKMTITAQQLSANQPMTASMFDGFDPPIGDDVSDKITGTHYRLWPDFEKIKAAGGKERVSIMGRVYLDGRPQAGIDVMTRTLYDPNSETHRRVKTTTDANGQFQLDDLILGFSYHIQAEHTQGYTAKTEVTLSELGTDYTDLKIDMTSGLTVTGTVTDPNGQAIPQARVRFRGKSTIKTDDQGRYSINGLYADQGYEVEAVAWGYAPLDPGGDVITKNFHIQLDEDGTPQPFDIQLQPEHILSGRVVDANNQPIKGVRVNVWSSPFDTDDLWKWYDAHTDTNGLFEIGHLGDRIYTFFVGQYGNVYHSPTESPLLFRVTGDSFMPNPLPGRQLVDEEIVARVESFERPYRRYFRLKEFHEASSKNKLINGWTEKLFQGSVEQRCEMLARLGSIPAYSALETYALILGGQSSEGVTKAGTVTRFDSNMNRTKSKTPCPDDLSNSTNPAIVCLTMRALARHGFAEDHAALLIGKLDNSNPTVRDYAQVTLAEMTGVSPGVDKSGWQTWLEQYQAARGELDTRSPERVLMGLAQISRDNKRSPQSIEQIMAAWQGASKSAAGFRARLNSDEGQALWNLLASIDLTGEDSIKYGHTMDYWSSDMFRDKGYDNYDLKFKFSQECTLNDKTFKPGVWYLLPALFRDAYIGQWEIVDLRFNDIKVDE